MNPLSPMLRLMTHVNIGASLALFAWLGLQPRAPESGSSVPPTMPARAEASNGATR